MTETANTAAAAVADMDANASLKAQVEALTARLAELEGNNIVQAQFKGEIPKYKLNEACYLDDALCEEGMEIEWMGAPNLSMVPMNDSARKRMEAYVRELTQASRARAERRGQTWNGQLISDRGVMLAEADQDARRAPQQVIAIPVERDGPLQPMPHTEEAQAQMKRRGRPPKNLASVKPPAPVKKPGGDPGQVLGKDRYGGLGGGQ